MYPFAAYIYSFFAKIKHEIIVKIKLISYFRRQLKTQ